MWPKLFFELLYSAMLGNNGLAWNREGGNTMNRKKEMVSHSRFFHVAVSAAVLFHFFSPWISFSISEALCATIEVETESDELDYSPGNGDCSLREAIENANNDDAAQADCNAGDGVDVIALPAGTYVLAGQAGDDDNTSGDLDISGVLTIDGAGRKNTFIQAGTSSPQGDACGDCVDRVLHILSSGVVVVNNVTIRYGRAPDGTSGADDKTGGGILNQGDLTLNDCLVGYNRAGDGLEASTGGDGGGLYSEGPLTLIDSTVAYNEAGDGGDGTTGTGGLGGRGGGLFLPFMGSMSMTGSRVVGNKSGQGGDGAGSASGDAANGAAGGMGGGIYADSSLTVSNSDIDQNETGPGGDGGVSSVSESGGDGGDGGYGAGIYCHSSAQLTLVESMVADNICGPGGSGGSGSGGSGSDGEPGRGGGAYMASGTHTIRRSLVNGNEAYHGGGLQIGNGADTTVINSTISGNIAERTGGGIWSFGPTALVLKHVTVTSNTADRSGDGGDGGGLFAVSNCAMSNTIVAGNIDSSGEYPDCRGEPVSEDYNLIGICEGVYCVFAPQANDLVGTAAAPVNPVLAILADNGGPTMTHQPKSNGPAAGQIPQGVEGCGTQETDQRGVMRLPPCDMGAYETGKVWSGDTNDDWHTAGNWLPAGVPANDHPVAISIGRNDPSCRKSTAEAGAISIAGGTLRLEDYDLAIGETP